MVSDNWTMIWIVFPFIQFSNHRFQLSPIFDNWQGIWIVSRSINCNWFQRHQTQSHKRWLNGACRPSVRLVLDELQPCPDPHTSENIELATRDSWTWVRGQSIRPFDAMHPLNSAARARGPAAGCPLQSGKRALSTRSKTRVQYENSFNVCLVFGSSRITTTASYTFDTIHDSSKESGRDPQLFEIFREWCLNCIQKNRYKSRKQY